MERRLVGTSSARRRGDVAADQGRDVLARCEYAKFNGKLQPLYEEAFTKVRAA